MQRCKAMALTTTILILTNSEYGQSNTMLAITSELVSRENVSVHVCSFPVLQRRVEAIRARMPPGATSNLEFHTLPGKSLTEAGKEIGFDMKLARHVPLKDSLAGFAFFDLCIAPWSGPEYMQLVEALKELVLRVDADMIVCDNMLSAAADACRSLRRRYVVNYPVQTLDAIKMGQPGLRGIWKYPALGSGIPYPVPWRQFFNNLWITINLIYTFIRAPRAAANQKYRLEHGLKGPPPIADLFRKELNYITPSIHETDYPFSYVPDNVKMCGPVVLDAPPVEHSDPELAAWLNNPGRRTLLISLGSNLEYDEKLIREMLSGMVNGIPDDVQVLWKLHKDASIVNLAERLVNEYDSSPQKTNRWRITGWLETDPAAILQHERVVCFVHHGGANSFLECCRAGVPQIILPQWFDLYDNADKAEFNGFGIYGSKTSAPNVDALEFGTALSRILGHHEEARRFRAKAQEVGRLCREAGGRKTAVDYIFEIVKRGKTMEALA